jgi:uncharacterized protein (DUF169 family)
MPTTLSEALALTRRPLAILLTDERPEQATQFKEGKFGCVAAMLLASEKGKTVVFDRKTYGCPGGGTGLGFGEAYRGFPIDCLLSTGGEVTLGNGHTMDFGEGERFFEQPLTARRWTDQLPIQDIPTQYLAVKPLEQVAEHEEPALVWFLANADQLSALIFLCNYRRGDLEPVTAPWGAACQSILFALAELERERPRGVIGFFDISQRHRVDRDTLSFTVPWALYEEMRENVAGSFLETEAWRAVRGR